MPAKPSLWSRLSAGVSRFAQAFARKPAASGVRMYASARQSRLTGGWLAPNSSADAELYTSLRTLRGRSRQLVRDAGFAGRAKMLVINNIIGHGIGIQAQVATTRDSLNERVNSAIEREFEHWMRAENCHLAGALHFHDIERLAMGEVFEAGDHFIRLHPVAVGESRVPLALELIEAERLADDYVLPGPTVNGNEIRMGVEVDATGRAVAYWIRPRHAGDIRTAPGSAERLERVPAEFIVPLFPIHRWPQTRGVPWLHAAAKKLHDLDEYTDAELTAARMSAYYFASVETAEENPMGAVTQLGADNQGRQQINIEPGMIEQLLPGEKLNFHAPNRPNSAADAFTRFMLREVASALNVSYASLSADYSQSNYSSSRLALLDDRDLWRVLQRWYVRQFRERLHRVWLQRAVYARAIPEIPVEQYAVDPQKFEAVRFKLRGWSWVDPTKEVAAYKEAVLAGFMTVADVIELTGNGADIEDTLNRRRQELDMMAKLGLKFDTEAAAATELQPVRPQPAADQSDEDAQDEAAEDDEQDAAPAARRVIPLR